VKTDQLLRAIQIAVEQGDSAATQGALLAILRTQPGHPEIVAQALSEHVEAMAALDSQRAEAAELKKVIKDAKEHLQTTASQVVQHIAFGDRQMPL
jgi:hypothetical protein